MARDIDLTKPLSKEDVAYLRTRYSDQTVDHMILTSGSEVQEADSEADAAAAEKAEADLREAAEKAEEERLAAEAAEAEAKAAAEAAQAEADAADLIGDPAGAEAYNPLDHTVAEVREYLDGASAEQREAVVEAEKARTDRDPRTGVVNYEPQSA